MKHVLIRQRKATSDIYKSYIFKFSKNVNKLLQDSNIFTKGLICNYVIKHLKDELNADRIFIDGSLNESLQDVIDEINNINRDLYLNNVSLYNKIDDIEKYWINGGKYEYNFKKYGDTFGHLIPMEKEYDDVIEVINDMNKQFDEAFKEYNYEKF